MSDAILHAAIAYAKQGWSVFPVYSVKDGVCACSKGEKCTSSGKHPKIRNWLNNATTDLEKIYHWFNRGDCNIGIATGYVSNIFVVDVDVKSGGLESMLTLDLPTTLKAKTGSGGYHFYYIYPPDCNIRNSVSKIASGIDIRGDGGYIIAPPSRHISGNSYEWSTL